MIKFNLFQNEQITGQAVDMPDHVEPGKSWKISDVFNSIELKPDSLRLWRYIQIQRGIRSDTFYIYQGMDKCG